MAGLTPQSVTFPVQFHWFSDERGSKVLMLFPATNHYVELSHVAMRDLHAQLTTFLQQREPKAVAP